VRTPVPPAQTPPIKINGDVISLKFDDATKKTFLSAVRQGYPIEQACGIAGISRQTLWRHRRKDARLNDDIDRARGMFALNTILKMDGIAAKAGDGLALDHWKWRLEKALPETFGKQAAYNQIGTQNNLLVVPELPSLDEIIAKITEQRTAALARQIESERASEKAEDAVVTLSPHEYVEALAERRADPLPD
jgi:hypothetical protein